jgi:large exoprotein involved in heme utilization and adhesion
VVINGPAAPGAASGILSEANVGSTGNAGTIRLTAGSLSIFAGGEISSTAVGPGNAGTILIDAGSASIFDTGLIATTTKQTGAGGDIDLAVSGNLLLSGVGPQIAAESTGTGNAGSITVSAANLTLQNGASISTQAATANGGNIVLSVNDFLYLVSSKITTSVGGAGGNGGNISIDPQLLVLDHSSIIAQAVAGHGGNIKIVAGDFLPSDDSIVSASSQLGISGSIELIGPRVDLNGSLVVLSSELRSAAEVLRTSCNARGRKQSSLVDAGHGGLPQDTGTTIPALYIANRDLGFDIAPAPGKAAEENLPLQPMRERVRLTMGCG